MNRRHSIEPPRVLGLMDRAWGYIALLAATGVMGFLVDAALKSQGY